MVNGLEGLSYSELVRHVVVSLQGAGGLEAISEGRRSEFWSKEMTLIAERLLSPARMDFDTGGRAEEQAYSVLDKPA